MTKNDITARLEKLSGKMSFYYKNLVTGETSRYYFFIIQNAH